MNHDKLYSVSAKYQAGLKKGYRDCLRDIAIGVGIIFVVIIFI